MKLILAVAFLINATLATAGTHVDRERVRREKQKSYDERHAKLDAQHAKEKADRDGRKAQRDADRAKRDGDRDRSGRVVEDDVVEKPLTDADRKRIAEEQQRRRDRALQTRTRYLENLDQRRGHRRPLVIRSR